MTFAGGLSISNGRTAPTRNSNAVRPLSRREYRGVALHSSYCVGEFSCSHLTLRRRSRRINILSKRLTNRSVTTTRCGSRKSAHSLSRKTLALRFASSPDSRSALVTATQRATESRRDISSARYSAPIKAGRGSLQSWTAATLDGGSNYNEQDASQKPLRASNSSRGDVGSMVPGARLKDRMRSHQRNVTRSARRSPAGQREGSDAGVATGPRETNQDTERRTA